MAGTGEPETGQVMWAFTVSGVTRRMAWVSVWAAVAVVLPLASCGPHQRGAGTEPQAQGRVEGLRQRAERLWEARRQEDWATVFLFQDPGERVGVDQADFITWCRQREPFGVHSFKLGEVLTEGDSGWVEINGRISIRRFPDAPPRDAHQWEKWRRVEGDWYLVPRQELTSHPASPALRDAAEEDRLLARFAESWEARQAGDWYALYELSDPRDRPDVTEEVFAQAQDRLVYLWHEIEWVEVVGDRGTVRVAYRHKLNDPSLTKLPPKLVCINEQWVRHENDWYLDLKRP